MTAMSIVAHAHPFVVGVDTHARNHVYAILDATNGALLDTQSFPTTAAGINRAIKWAARRTNADADTLWVIEGAASYGAILAGTVATHGFPVAEAPGMDAKKRRGVGKSDALDAHRIAMAVLSLPVDKLRRPRLHDGVRQGVRLARHVLALDEQLTANENQLDELVKVSEAAPLLEETGVQGDQRREVSLRVVARGQSPQRGSICLPGRGKSDPRVLREHCPAPVEPGR